MLTEFLQIGIGVAIILVLGDLVIRNAVDLAQTFRLSGAFIGLTVLSLGTSIPEIMTNLVGSVDILMHPEQRATVSALVLGTNVGSVVFQQSFALPVVGLVGVITVKRRELAEQVGAMLAAAALLWVFCLGGELLRIEGLVMLAAYAVYLLYLFKHNHVAEHVSHQGSDGRRKTIVAILIIVGCFVVIAVVADQVVAAATRLVHQLPVSASFLGVICLGTASTLPELATSLISILRGQKEITAGILIGSTVTNTLVGVGVGGLISGYAVPRVLVFYDLPAMISIAALLYVFLRRDEDLNRGEALVLIALFAVYLVLRQHLFPADVAVGG